ncbi:MAG TPA: hypothetical protein VLG25_01615 [Patescibacteria group bacterium]|nr:hypothetical protein [Patescibacteria group bacterium]
METLLASLQKDFPDFTFTSGETFCWSPHNKQVIYAASPASNIGTWSLLHELGHGLLDHQSYETDLELLLLEVEAWTKARELAVKYKIEIDDDHIEDCMDTYRDWLDARSTCPECTHNGLQISSRQYSCYNCRMRWQVTSSRFSRPYRLTKVEDKKEKSPKLLAQTTFL